MIFILASKAMKNVTFEEDDTSWKSFNQLGESFLDLICKYDIWEDIFFSH